MKLPLVIEQREDYRTMEKLFYLYCGKFKILEGRLTVEDHIADRIPRKIRFMKWLLEEVICSHDFKKCGKPWITGYIGDGVAYSQIYKCNGCSKEETRNLMFDIFSPFEGMNVDPR